MKRILKTILLIFLVLVLLAELTFIGYQEVIVKPGEELMQATEPVFVETEPIIVTEAPTEEPTEEATEAETEPTEEETEPVQENTLAGRFVLTFAGDCTLGSTAAKASSPSSFIKTIGTNYDYPFANVVKYFEEDDFTIVNLEGPLTETGYAAQKTFAFKGPTAYTQILTGSSVEAVTLANNHSEDYGSEGYKNTAKALNQAGVAYVEKDGTTMVITESGLKIGLYAASFNINKKDMQNDIALLRQSGAEVVICCFHWGTEGAYRPDASQEKLAQAAIDAGADIVYGSHPHVLQKVEAYQDGYIFYSLGNFSFGGSVFPQDYDSALLQMEILRDEEGVITLGELTMIPVSISSMKGQNNFQPTPLKEGTTEYDRAMSKLTGDFKGPNLKVDYSTITGDKEETTPPTEAPTEAPSQTPTEAPSQGGSAPTESPSTGGDSGSSSGGEGSGSTDSGSSGSADSGSGSAPSGGESSSGGSGDAGSAGGAPSEG